MPKLIKNNCVVDDAWQVARDEAALGNPSILVSLPLWQAHKDTLSKRTDVGLLLTSSDEPENIAGDVNHFAVIAVEFPVFTDGRGYTIARLLRERYGFTGEIRAVGDVLQDQLFYMKRCGFDAFAVREDKNIEGAIKSLNDFSNVYQAGVDEPLPLFRRR